MPTTAATRISPSMYEGKNVMRDRKRGSCVDCRGGEGCGPATIRWFGQMWCESAYAIWHKNWELWQTIPESQKRAARKTFQETFDLENDDVLMRILR
jgi:hypothetical protein